MWIAKKIVEGVVGRVAALVVFTVWLIAANRVIKDPPFWSKMKDR